jgi:nitrogenase molybdenum-iron protein alpha chain
MTAINSVLALKDTLVVDHAPMGCSGVYMIFGGAYDLNAPGPDGSYREQARLITTKLTETDTIFGAADKLRHVVRSAYDRHHPKEIYIASSCVSAIIGEDVEAMAGELAGEIGIPVTPLSAAGLESGLWATGFDAYCHAVAKTRIKPSPEKGNVILYSGFAPTASEEVKPLFRKLGLDLVCLTGGGSVEEYGRAASAVCSFGQCDVQANYILRFLEQEYGVKYFHTHQPNGGVGFERFMSDLGAYLGKSAMAEEIVVEERAKYENGIDRLREGLRGKRAVIALGSGYAFETARMLGELGMKTVHAVAYHYDPVSGDGSDGSDLSMVADNMELGLDPDTSVNNAQAIETYLVIRKYRPDIVISRAHGASCWAVKCGIPCLDMGLGMNIIGYRGLFLLGSAIEGVLRNTAFFEKLGARYRSPFSGTLEHLGPHRFYGDEEDCAGRSGPGAVCGETS